MTSVTLLPVMGMVTEHACPVEALGAPFMPFTERDEQDIAVLLGDQPEFGVPP